MLASKLSAPCKQARASGRAAAPAVPRARRTCVRAVASQQCSEEVAMGRRQLFAGVAGMGMAVALSQASPVKADGEYATFLGYATPPTSYGGYGGNDPNNKPRYTFQYPLGWKEEVPNKVEKGTQGIDGRVVNPRSKNERAFLITLGRAGEDNKSFRLTDLDSTLAGFAGADYDLQDALSGSTERTTSSRELDGQTFYDYDINSPEFRYLVTITVSQGKVFGLFVRSPAKTFAANETKLRNIISTFRLI